MDINVTPVRLVFNVDSINAVAVSSNWLYLTGGPSTVVRINLDTPTRVEDIQIPRKHVSTAGFIKYLFTDASGESLLAVTSKCEHFYYSGTKQEFKHLGKLRGTTTVCAYFYNRYSFLMGTKAGNIVEVGIDSSANETYFKRDLRLAAQVWKSPRKDPVTSIVISGGDVIASCGYEVLHWSDPKGVNGVRSMTSSLGEPLFQRLFQSDPKTLISEPRQHKIKQLVRSPDKKTLAATLGSHKIAFSRTSAVSDAVPARTKVSKNGAKSSRATDYNTWHEVDLESSLEYLLVSNYYLLAIVAPTPDSYSVLAINLFSQQHMQTASIPASQPIKGVCMDQNLGTFWLFSHESLYEIRLSNEEAGMWKILSDQHKFDEALEITNSHSARSYVMDRYGHYLLATEPKRAAEFLGLSDSPFEIAALEVIHRSPEAMPDLIKARLSHTKSKAQQIMLTSLLAELGDYSFLESSGLSWDFKTISQVLKDQGDFKTYLAVMIHAGDISGAIAYHVANENWEEALDLIRQYEERQSESVYKYASILLAKAPRPTVESWMRMQSLDKQRLLPSLISYANDYRGPVKENQALRYLKHVLNNEKSGSMTAKAGGVSIFNAAVSMLSIGGKDEDVLGFLKIHAPKFNDLFFALRMCLKNDQYRSAVYLYTLTGLYEDAVQICLDIGTEEMFDLAIDIACNRITTATQGNEELRKYLLRKIAQRAIAAEGTSAAIKFIKLLRVDDLLEQFPDFDTLSNLAPEIVKSLEQTNTRLNNLSQQIDDTLQASEDVQREFFQFKRRSVLVEPGEACFICSFPLVTRKFVVFPCQHGFHMDCAESKLKAAGLDNSVTDECILCSKHGLRQIEMPLETTF